MQVLVSVAFVEYNEARLDANQISFAQVSTRPKTESKVLLACGYVRGWRGNKDRLYIVGAILYQEGSAAASKQGFLILPLDYRVRESTSERS